MKPVEKLKTITLSDASDNPVVSLCPGHVDVKTFNAAYEEEGWQGDPIRKEELRFEFWIRGSVKKAWKRSDNRQHDAEPFTAIYW